MIRRKDRIEFLKSRLDSFKDFNVPKNRELFNEALDNIACEINSQMEKFL